MWPRKDRRGGRQSPLPWKENYWGGKSERKKKTENDFVMMLKIK